MVAVLPLLDDSVRSPDPNVCPFLRREVDGKLFAPVPEPDDHNACTAIGYALPQSGRQQELVCLRASHADCPRYLRGAGVLGAPVRTRPKATVPRATIAALLVLVLSAGISLGFVVQRGGIDLPAVAPAQPSTEAAAVVTPEPEPSESPAPAATPSPSPEPTAPPSPSPTPLPTASPSPTPPPTPAITPTPRPSATPKGDRYALLTRCPDRKGCWIYVVRSGDNLYSIARYFGHTLATIYEWNPRYAQGAGLRKGDEIRMPPPTR